MAALLTRGTSGPRWPAGHADGRGRDGRQDAEPHGGPDTALCRAAAPRCTARRAWAGHDPAPGSATGSPTQDDGQGEARSRPEGQEVGKATYGCVPDQPLSRRKAAVRRLPGRRTRPAPPHHIDLIEGTAMPLLCRPGVVTAAPPPGPVPRRA